jgi:hypothetical protein
VSGDGGEEWMKESSLLSTWTLDLDLRMTLTRLVSYSRSSAGWQEQPCKLAPGEGAAQAWTFLVSQFRGLDWWV